MYKEIELLLLKCCKNIVRVRSTSRIPMNDPHSLWIKTDGIRAKAGEKEVIHDWLTHTLLIPFYHQEYKREAAHDDTVGFPKV
jgi:hypothetical protein